MYGGEVSSDAIHIYIHKTQVVLPVRSSWVWRLWKVHMYDSIPENGLLWSRIVDSTHIWIERPTFKGSANLRRSCQLLFHVFATHPSTSLRSCEKISVGTFNRPSPSAQREEMVHKIRNNKFHLPPINHHDVDEILFNSYGPGFAELGVVGILPIQ
jgi:hypothetical protein